MDKTAFLTACRAMMEGSGVRRGIGTLGEKSLHAALKLYFDPVPEHHEMRVGNYVADVCNEQGIVEIQTRGFERLRSKLNAFLDIAPVTVVYPVPAINWLIWVEKDGTAAPPKKTTRRPTACEILPELYKLKPFLGRKGLSFCILMLETEDYRLKDGYGPHQKIRATKYDRYPIDLIDEVWISTPEDYKKLIPETLPEIFTVKEFGKAAKLTGPKASVAVNVLFSVNAVERVGKEKRAYLYRRTPG